jgi:hypothetical protein
MLGYRALSVDHDNTALRDAAPERSETKRDVDTKRGTKIPATFPSVAQVAVSFNASCQLDADIPLRASIRASHEAP